MILSQGQKILSGIQPVLVSRLTPANAGGYRALMLEAYATEPEAFTSTVAEREVLPLEWWESRVSEADDAESVVFGAFVDGSLVGAVGLRFEQRPRTRHKALLYGTFVRPAYRGRGIARKLVQSAVDHARAASQIRLVLLRVTASNAAAVRLYESFGFCSYGTEPYANRVDDRLVAVTNMWCPVKPLTGADRYPIEGDASSP